MTATEPTDRQLRASIYKIVRAYLEERVLTSVSGSFFAHLIAVRAAAEVDEPWQHPALASADPRVRRATDHARAFSAVMHAASLTYNLVLARKVRDLHGRGEDDRVDDYRQRLADWADEVHGDSARSCPPPKAR